MAKRHSAQSGTLQAIFGRLEELVLANSGEDEFEEIWKLVVAKLWDESNNGPSRFYARETGAATLDCIKMLLGEVERAWPGILETSAPCLTPGHLHVCVEALAPHNLHGEGLAVLDAFFEFLVARGAKSNKGQYFTPRHVIEFCVRLLRPSLSETVVDPACGSGGFLMHTLDYVRREYNLLPGEIPSYSANHLWGFDVDSRAVRVAKALMILAGDGHSNIVQLNSLLKPPSVQGTLEGMLEGMGNLERTESQLTIEDICRARQRGRKGFDVVLTNPPFAGEVREASVLDGYVLGRNKTRIERDVLFVERCLELLRPGGRMGIVLPHNKLSSALLGEFRSWLVTKAQIVAVVGLGRHTFLPHTHQKAGVVFLRKLAKGERARSDYSIFFAVNDLDGKDGRGELRLTSNQDEDAPLWERVDHDFHDIKSAFDEFLVKESLAWN